MAYAVVNLLRNLEESGGGQARDRLLALRILYDEVLNSAHTMLRHGARPHADYEEHGARAWE